jgi:hypothetical protein
VMDQHWCRHDFSQQLVMDWHWSRHRDWWWVGGITCWDW